MLLRTRFAPSPTGLMHVGNAFAALQCQKWAADHHAQLLLRIEDIDHTRCKPEYTQQIIDDLRWLGLKWDGEVRKQSEHLDCYHQALLTLNELEVIYPCFCTRKHIQQEIGRMGVAPHKEDLCDPYPGTCRHIPHSERSRRMASEPFAWRLDCHKASKRVPSTLFWLDHQQQQHMVQPQQLGDIVIARKDIGVSYHLAVVVDDALQSISHIIRGEDLYSSTPIHRLLQALLKLPSPSYQHHRLIHDAEGKRLAKRNQSTTLTSLRHAGISNYTLRQFLMRENSSWPFKDDQTAAYIASQLGSLP